MNDLTEALRHRLDAALAHPVGRPLVAGLATAATTLLAQGVFWEQGESPVLFAVVLGLLTAAAVAPAIAERRFAGNIAKALLFAWATFVAAKWMFQTPNGLMIYAAALGSLYGLLAAGIIIVYRTNRIVNFAVGGMGAVPAVFALTLMTTKGLSYWFAAPLALVCGAVLGALIDVVVIRRFADAPRLILTVVTIGVSQFLSFIAFFTPDWLGTDLLPEVIRTPFTRFEAKIQGQIITGDYAVAAVVVTIAVIGLGLFFRYTRMGVAIRASAENADRAALLGIPVTRVRTVAWMIAGLFSAITLLLRAPLVGLPLGGLGSVAILLFALAAAVVARMESIPTALFAGMAIGVIDQSSVFATGSSNLAAAIMLIVIVAALLVQRTSLSRADDTGVSSFKTVKEFRKIPPELRRLPELRWAKLALGGAAAAFFLLAPWYLGSELGKGTLIAIYSIVAVSLVVLTGWAGQISLGQFAFAGIGAAVAGGLAANHNIDLFAALFVGGLAGAFVSVIIGIPALRVQGLFLAVTTLAFAAATDAWILSSTTPVGELLLPDPGNRIERPILWGRISLGGPLEARPMYFFSLVILGLVVLAATAFRRNRSGRVLIAVRDNGRAASSYNVNLARTRLAAFAVSGWMAATAGVLLAYQTLSIDNGQFPAATSVAVFAAAVIGGMGSIGGAISGVIFVFGISFFEQRIGIENLALLVTGPGLVMVLYLLPGGFAEGFYRVRDLFLRHLAAKHDIHVPSLVADRRVEDGEEGDGEVTPDDVELVDFDLLAEEAEEAEEELVREGSK